MEMEMDMELEDQFMPSEGLLTTEDSSQWDVLVSKGVNAEAVANRWDRESLFIKFDPLVGQAQKQRAERNSSEEPDNHGISIKTEPPENDENQYPCVDLQDHLFNLPAADHVFAIPQPKSLKLVPIETPPPPHKLFSVPVTPVPYPKVEEVKVAPPGIEPDLPGSGVSPDTGSFLEPNVSQTEYYAIHEMLATQKQQFLTELEEKEKMVQELMSARDSQMAAGDQNNSRVLVEYEKTMSSYVTQTEELKNKLTVAQVDKLEAQKERDQALEDLKHVEEAFSLLHQKYERVKGTLENFRKNEELLKLRDAELSMKCENRDRKLETLKEESTSRMTVLCQDYEAKYSGIQSENLKLRALLRKNEMAVQTLGQNLEQKQKENIELNKLCEELIGGGLSVQ